MSVWLPLIVCGIGLALLVYWKKWETIATYLFAVGLLVLLIALAQAHVGFFLR